MNSSTYHSLSIIARFALVAAIAVLGYQVHQNNELLEQQARYVHVQHKLAGNQPFISDDKFRRVFLRAEAEDVGLGDTEIVLIFSYHINTYLKWEWFWQQYAATDPDMIPLESWGHYLRVYPKTLEAWEWRKNHFSPEFVQFFDEVLEPGSRRVD